MIEYDLKYFRIIAHTHRLAREGGSRVGYHCPDCGCFYAEGNFTIENATYVLGTLEQKSCCKKIRPTPLLFETLGEAQGFVSRLEASDEWERATLIAKHVLLSAHFNQKLVSEQKRKTLH